MENVLACVAAYETEVRAERVRAGQSVAKANGTSWGGSVAGVGKKVRPEQERAIRQLKAEGAPIVRIAKSVGLTRLTVTSVLNAG